MGYMKMSKVTFTADQVSVIVTVRARSTDQAIEMAWETARQMLDIAPITNAAQSFYRGIEIIEGTEELVSV